MEDLNIKTEESAEERNMWNDWEKKQRRGKVMGGLLIVTAGALFLARELGAQIPFWIFSWKMLLIGMGVILAVKHKFMHPGWIILIGVGGAFLLSDLYPGMNIRPILWPCLIILVGLLVIFQPRKRAFTRYRRKLHKFHNHRHHHRHHRRHHHHYQDFRDHCPPEVPVTDDYIDSTVIMGGVKRNILSKNFRGGEVTNVFGGAELNLTQADFEEKASLEITQVFGGTKLLVPANWGIRSELVTIFGSVEDKRPVQPQPEEGAKKVLVLTGTMIFGGIEIKSF